jgi:hypothetical protein
MTEPRPYLCRILFASEPRRSPRRIVYLSESAFRIRDRDDPIPGFQQLGKMAGLLPGDDAAASKVWKRDGGLLTAMC